MQELDFDAIARRIEDSPSFLFHLPPIAKFRRYMSIWVPVNFEMPSRGQVEMAERREGRKVSLYRANVYILAKNIEWDDRECYQKLVALLGCPVNISEYHRFSSVPFRYDYREDGVEDKINSVFVSLERNSWRRKNPHLNLSPLKQQSF